MAAGVPRQLLLPNSDQLVLPVHLLRLALLLGCISPEAGDVKLGDDGVMHHRSTSAAVAKGLAKMNSYSEKTRFEVMPKDIRWWRSAVKVEERLGVPGTSGQIA